MIEKEIQRVINNTKDLSKKVIWKHITVEAHIYIIGYYIYIYYIIYIISYNGATIQLLNTTGYQKA